VKIDESSQKTLNWPHNLLVSKRASKSKFVRQKRESLSANLTASSSQQQRAFDTTVCLHHRVVKGRFSPKQIYVTEYIRVKERIVSAFPQEKRDQNSRVIYETHAREELLSNNQRNDESFVDVVCVVLRGTVLFLRFFKRAAFEKRIEQHHRRPPSTFSFVVLPAPPPRV
jgi:hypothetical protein